MAARTPKAPVITDPFRATGSDLRTAAAAGNDVAIAELARRAANKAAKATTVTE
jgi:hypothetical protein